MKKTIILLISIIIILIIIIIALCRQREESGIEVITMNHTRPINELKELVLTKGDTAAYDELAIAFMNEKYYEEYLIYSILMANKYHYPRAYFYVYFCLAFQLEYDVKSLDEETIALAIRYLKKAVELQDCSATVILSELYMKGKYVQKDTILGKKLDEKSRKLCGF
jgi:TPR repeat protein